MEEHPPVHLGVVATEKGAFGSPSTKVANFFFLRFQVTMLIVTLICTRYNDFKVIFVSYGPVRRDCRILYLDLFRGVRLSKPVSYIWWWGFSNTGAFENAEYLFIAIAPRSTVARSFLSIELWHLNFVFDISTECKQITNAKLNCLN